MKTSALMAAAAAAILAAGCRDDKPVLHIYTWSDYIAPEVIQGFEEANGCKVVVDTFDSNENMYAKLKAGGSGYDIIMPSSYFVPLLAKEGLIAPIDKTKIPNVAKNFDKSFESQITDPDFKFSVPYAVTYTGIMYAKDKVPAGADVESWSIFSNPAFKGKATFLDDIREVIGAGLMSLGYSLNSKNPKEIDEAVAQVLKWKANVRKFDAESYKTEVASSATWLGHGYSTDAMQVIVGDEEAGDAPRKDIGFALPKEGFVIAFDEMAVSSGAPNPALAYAFIDYVYDGEVAKVNMEYNMGPMPVAPGIAALDDEYRDQIVLKPEVAKRGQVLRPVEDDPAVKALYDKAWDRIKATGGAPDAGK
ncbi:MAG: spermidine/putrescine ABC transporter substrate-binding protein [Kiritimatiellae bacterium]|nr:spermidine/putrescine ABC transporter substrate-binding protein [Kiritimatiellia bacterium]